MANLIRLIERATAESRDLTDEEIEAVWLRHVTKSARAKAALDRIIEGGDGA